jgi:hypothetical protein
MDGKSDNVPKVCFWLFRRLSPCWLFEVFSCSMMDIQVVRFWQALANVF